MVMTENTSPRRLLRAFSRYRPRVLTLLVLVIVAALLLLANLSYSESGARGDYAYSYGWPVVWYRLVLIVPIATAWQLNRWRLALSAAAWIIILAATAIGCEWQLRRHPPRLRWSLRTMFVAVALLAGFCGWFVSANKRAQMQDELITELGGQVWLERWGPRWLDRVGADRYFRYVVGARSVAYDGDEGGNERLLKKLSQLPRLQYLVLGVERVTPAMEEALSQMSELRALSVSRADVGSGFWPAIGRLTNLEHLWLEGVTIGSDSFEALATLTRLKTLSLDYVHAAKMPFFGPLHALPCLEGIYVWLCPVGDLDVERLLAQPQLRTLKLENTQISDAGLARLSTHPTLEEFSIYSPGVTSKGLLSLASLKRLRRLHIYGFNVNGESTEERRGRSVDDKDAANDRSDDAATCRLALKTLRDTHPGIEIDCHLGAVKLDEEEAVASRHEYYLDAFSSHLPFVPWLTSDFWKRQSEHWAMGRIKW